MSDRPLVLELTDDARSDLGKIRAYGIKHFGASQARRFQLELDGFFEMMCRYPFDASERVDLEPGVYSRSFRKTYVVYYVLRPGTLRVIGVRSTRSDPRVMFERIENPG